MDVATTLRECSTNRQGLANSRQLMTAGISRTRLSRALTQGDIVRVRPRVYALEPLPPLPRFVVTPEGVAPAYVAHVRAVLLSMGATAVACGRTAAALFGWPLLVEPVRTVEVGVPHGRSHAAGRGILVRRHRTLALWERAVIADADPLRMTSPVQTLIDCALTRPLIEAVVIWDSALRVRHVTMQEVRTAAESANGVRAAARVRRVASFVADDSGSVPETVLRLRLLQAGLDFRTQHVITDHEGRHLLRADVCFPERQLVVEVDGARWHEDAVKDQRTDNALAALGWRVLRYAGREVLREWKPVVGEVERAVAVAPAATTSTQLWQVSAA
jgi:very-short-patch-repair endonuclease